MAAVHPQIKSGFASEPGLRRRNEDYGDIRYSRSVARGFVAAVADGIGGGPGGREAAEIAVKTFLERYCGAPASVSARNAARDAVEDANAAILAAIKRNPELSGMGTTLSALVLQDREAHIVHVGDSRIYRLRHGELAALTEDHNLRALGMPNILTRSLGSRGEAAPDCDSQASAPGDRYLLCTDGVTGAVGDDEIAEILSRQADPQIAANAIVAAALAAGSSDNATALVVGFGGRSA